MILSPTYLKTTAMKKFLVLFFTSCSLSAFACGDYGALVPRWSIGVIGYGSFEMPVSGSLAGAHSYFLPGIQFGHTTASGKWTHRIALERIQRSMESPEIPPGGADMMMYEGSENRTLLRIGVEREWQIRRWFRPYAALDLAGKIGKSDFTYSGGIAGLHQREEYTFKGIGLLPAIGIKSFIGNRISVYAEYRAEAFLNDVDKTFTYYNGYVDSRPYPEAKTEFYAGEVLTAGVQVLF
jgi:hypothetical protein